MNYEYLNYKQIRNIRIANGLTQKEFADFLNIPIGTWSNVELGNTPLYKEVRAKATQALKELGCDFSVARRDVDFPKWTQAIKGQGESPVIKAEQVDVEGEKVIVIGAQPSIETVVNGVGKDEPIVINEEGGGQSRVLYDFTLADPKAMFEMTKVLKEGADKYGAENWRLISIEDHLNHMLIHAYAYLAGDKSDEHLSHIMCRALFAQAVELQTEEDIQKVREEKQRRGEDA